MFPRLHGEKGATMPDKEDLERRLWRTMPWDASVMVPTPEQDAIDEAEEDDKIDHIPGL